MIWNKLSDKLPKNGETVIVWQNNLTDGDSSRWQKAVYYENSHFRIYPMGSEKCFLQKEQFKGYDLEGDMCQLTHWMESPKAPNDIETHEDNTYKIIDDEKMLVISPPSKGKSFYMHMLNKKMFLDTQIEYLKSLIQRIKISDDGSFVIPQNYIPNHKFQEEWDKTIGFEFIDLYRVFSRMSDYIDTERYYKIALQYVELLKTNDYLTTINIIYRQNNVSNENDRELQE